MNRFLVRDRAWSASRACAVGLLIAGCLAGTAEAQSGTAFYSSAQSGNVTWSNSANWFTTMAANTTTSAPGTMTLAVLTTNTAGAAVLFDSDASAYGILVNTRGALGIYRAVNATTRTLRLGAGGIQWQSYAAGAATFGSVTTGSGKLNVQLDDTQEWRKRGTGALTFNNDIVGTAASGVSQTLVVWNPLAASSILAQTSGTFVNAISDGANGGKLNLWINAGRTTNVSANSTFSGTLTVQGGQNLATSGSSGQGFAWAGSGTTGTLYVKQLQFAGGGLANVAGVTTSYILSSTAAAPVRFLGGANYFGDLAVLAMSGSSSSTINRSVGGGLLAASGGNVTGVANDVNLNGLIPWAVGNTQTAGARARPLYYVSGTLQESDPTASPGTPGVWTNPTSWSAVTSSTANYGNWSSFPRAAGNVTGYGGGVEYLTGNVAGSMFAEMPNFYVDVNANTWTANAFTIDNSNVRIDSSGGGGGLVIGPSGELVMTNVGGTAVLAAPIRESSAGGWFTYGAAVKSGNYAAGVLTLSGSNSHSGGTSLVSGSVNLNSAYALGSGTFLVNGAVVLDNTSSGPLTIATNNYQKWNSDFTFIGTQPLNLGTGSVSLGDWSGTLRTVTINSGTLAVGGRIVDGNASAVPTTGIVKDGLGVLALSGSNGYTGQTQVYNGELRFTNRNALYGGDSTKWTAGRITVLSLNSATAGILSVSVTGTNPFTASDLDALAGVGSDTGGFGAGGQFAGFLGIDTTGTSYTYSTSIADPNSGRNRLGLAKVGSGTLALTGVNTFTGGVIVREGTLQVPSGGLGGLGTGVIILSGGKLDLGGNTYSGSMALGSGTVSNGTLTAGNMSTVGSGTAVIQAQLTGGSFTVGNAVTGGGAVVKLENTTNVITSATIGSNGGLMISSSSNLSSVQKPDIQVVASGAGFYVAGTALTSSDFATWGFTNNPSFTIGIVDAGNNFTFSDALQNAGATQVGITKAGPGKLTLTGNNVFSNVVVTGGTLAFAAQNALNFRTPTQLMTSSNGTIDLGGFSTSSILTGSMNNSTLQNGTLGARGFQFVNSNSISANLADSAGGAGVTQSMFVSGTGVTVLSGNNTWTGVATIVGATSVSGASTAGAMLQYAKVASLYSGNSANWTATKFCVRADNTIAFNVGGAGEFTSGNIDTLLGALGGAVTGTNGLQAGSRIGFDTSNAGGSFTLSQSQVVADTTGTGGAVGLVKLGTGTLLVSASNTYTGQTWVGTYGGNDAGTLKLDTNGYVSGTVAVYGGTFDVNGQNRTVNALWLGGGAAGSTAGLQTGSGTATLGGGVTYSGLNAANGATISGNLALGGATRTFVVNDSSAATNDLTVSAAISDGGSAAGLTKLGFGTLLFSGSNTYSGATLISQGRLHVNSTGALGGGGAVTVNGPTAEFKYNSATPLTAALTLTQGTLSGTGTISATGGVSVGSGVIMSPGNSPGMETFATGLTLNPGGTYLWEVNSGTGAAGTNWDLVNVSGGSLNLAALSGAAQFILDLTTLTGGNVSGTMDNYVAGTAYNWRIYDAVALTLPASFGASSGSYAPGTDVSSLFSLLWANWKNTVPNPADVSVRVASTGTGLDLVVVPEPATIGLAAVGSALAVLAARRRRRG